MATSALVLTNGLPVMTSITASATPAYDQSIYYSSGLTASTNITLPASGTFSSSSAADIIITVNGILKEITRDFSVVGGGPTYTQIQFSYALPNDAVVRFKSHLG